MVKKKSPEMDLSAAIKRPFQDATKLIIGCALNIVPIVNFLSLGYVLKSGELTLKKKSKIPEWDDWGDFFVKGLLAFIIGLLWMIPAIIIGVVGGGTAIAAFVGTIVSGGTPSFGAIVGAGIVLIVAFLLALITVYFIPAAVFGYIHKGKFGEAFNFSTVFRKALSGKYFIAWLLTMIVCFVLSLLGGLIPIARVVLVPTGQFIGLMIGVTLIGSIYKNL